MVKKSRFKNYTILAASVSIALVAGYGQSLVFGDTGKLDAQWGKADQSYKRADDKYLCFPEISGEGEIHLINRYAGRPNSRDENKPAKTIDVEVRKTEKPVLLALTSYSSVVWRINAYEDAKIAGVMISGYDESTAIGVPAGVSVGKTFHKAKWSSQDSDCVLTSRAKKASVNERAVINDETVADYIRSSKPFLYSKYFRLNKPQSRESFVKAVKRIAPFELASYNGYGEKSDDYSFEVSAQVTQAFRAGVRKANKEVAFYQNPKNKPILNMRSINEEPYLFKNPETAINDAASMGYLKDGTKEFAYYCGYRAALMRSEGRNGDGACQFVVNKEFKTAFTVLGNFEFPKEACLDEPAVFMLGPGVRKPYISHCSGRPHLIQYRSVYDKPCTLDQSRCKIIEKVGTKKLVVSKKKTR